MHDIDNGPAAARLRANRRLHRMTLGTALFGIAATGGLGLVAAGGSEATTTTTSIVEPSTTEESPLDASTSTDPADADDGATSGSTTITGTSGRAHASSGGS